MNAKLEAMQDQLDELKARPAPSADGEVNICMGANGLSEQPAVDWLEPPNHAVAVILHVTDEAPSMHFETAAADGPMERRMANLERLVHEQAVTIEDQGRRLLELEIDRAEAPPQPQPAAEDVGVRPSAPEGVVLSKHVTRADAHACRRRKRPRLAACQCQRRVEYRQAREEYLGYASLLLP